MRESQIHAIALSVASCPATHNVWDACRHDSPSRHYERLALDCPLRTQDYITACYSAEPLGAAEQILEACRRKSIAIIDYWHDSYPRLLREIARPPLVLYARGSLDSGKMIAIVGTRNADPQSIETARRLSMELASAGLVVVSGMARGIDREAHLGALSAGGATYGVLANGIDVVYPMANSDLYEMILADKRSCLISEYPPGIMAGKWTFTRRNRIISGLSLGTVVVKAGRKSGALITARYALDQGRELFVCPGPTFDATYYGGHGLVNEGAMLISDTEDVLRELGVSPPYDRSTENRTAQDFEGEEVEAAEELPSGPVFPAGSIESRILSRLDRGGVDVDELIRSLEASVSSVREALMTLEIEGLVVRSGTAVLRN